MRPATYKADLMQIQSELIDAYDDLLRKKERADYLRAKASSCGAIRYDKDRVQSSHNYDLSDVILNIIEAEEDVKKAYCKYMNIVNELKHCMNDAGFDMTQQSVWLLRYANKKSLGYIAKSLNITKSHVQYLLSSRAETRLAEYAI